MKLKRILFIYMMICFGNVESRSRGKIDRISGAALIRKYPTSSLKEADETILKIKTSTPIPLITKHNLKKNTAPIEILSNPLIVTNTNNGPGFSKQEKLSMKVDGHLIKVSSSLHSKHLDVKRKDGELTMSVNPKFSHVIEIIPENEDNEELDNLMITEDSFNNEEELTTQLHPEYKLNDESTSSERCIGISCLRAPINSEVPDRVQATEFDIKENLEPQVTLNQDLVSDETASTEDLSSDFHKKPDIKENLEPEITQSTTLNQDLVSNETASTEDSFEFHKNEQAVAFNDEIEGSGEEFSSRDVENENDSKSARLLGFLSQRNNASNPICTTPKGEKGKCRRITQCILSDSLNNFNFFLQQLCLIRGVMVGVCCPDNPVIEITDPDDDNATEISTPLDEIKQPPEGCGLNTKTRIVGGTISLPHEWTWMVALMRRNRFYCGGVIINNWYILTAAHCVIGMDVKELTVRLGEYDFNENNKHQEDISVSEIKRHAQFVTLTFQHDVALLKLKRSVKYSKFVGSICLPSQKARDYSDEKGTVVGWGTVSFGGAASPILRQITVPVWKNEDCDDTYLLENINDAFMCAGSPEKGEDACQGDSGGPLMTVNEKGRWEVIGIVSWGRRCGDPKYPGVYTRVTTYLDWINENIN